MAAREIGIVGLGKMGKNIALQALSKGYPVVAYDISPGPLNEVAAKGAVKAGSMLELVRKLRQPRTVWVMLPAGEVTSDAIVQLASYCGRGDVIIDGSNSFYRESVALYGKLAKKGISYLDAGCSGGPSGALNGMCIMVGGDKSAFRKSERLFRDLSVANGCFYTGKPGSGHFVKMVHNAVEYGMMQSIGEGLELMESGPYEGLDLGGICELWNNGSVVRGYLMALAARAIKSDPHLSSTAPYVEDTGEGRWSVKEAVEYGVPFWAITGALYSRFESRAEKRFGKRVLAALRHEFGGHAIRKG